MQCPKCEAQENIEIRGKIFCARCGSTIQESSGGRRTESASPEETSAFEVKVVESKEFAVRPNYYLPTKEPAALLEQPKLKRNIALDVSLIIFLLGLGTVIVLSFVYKPLSDFRSKLTKNASQFIQKQTKPVYEIDNFKNKMQLVQEKALGWSDKAYLAFVDLSDDPSFKPSNFSTNNTYHCVFMNSNNKEIGIFFIRRNNDQIVGSIKVAKKDLNIPSEDSNIQSLQVSKIKYLPNEVYPVAAVNGLKDFLQKYKNAQLKMGPLLAYSNKYGTNYWLYIYNTPDNKHKFMAKVSADNGKILEVSER